MLFAVTPEVLLQISAFWGGEDLLRRVYVYTIHELGKEVMVKAIFFFVGLICIRYRQLGLFLGLICIRYR